MLALSYALPAGFLSPGATRNSAAKMDMSTQQEYPGLKDGEISTGVSPLSLSRSRNERIA